MTISLLRLNAVVGVKGTVDRGGRLTKVGVTCALCHSSVDDSLAPGVGKRLDGWANTDLNVGAIVALSPALDEATKAEFRSWGPGKYDPRHHAFDGTNIIPLNSPSVPIVIPPIYGLKGVGFETVTADGPIWYWNSYVGVGQMGGHGNFADPRIGLFIRQTPDLVTPKLAALLDYQLSLRSPKPGGQLQCRGCPARQACVPQPGPVQHVPSGAELHRRPERSGPARAVSARSIRSRDGPRVRGQIGNRQVSDDTTARASPAPAVLPRRERARSDGRRESLRQAVRPQSDGESESRSRRVL